MENEFNYFSGDEIVKNRMQLISERKQNEYEEFCKRMSLLWADEHIQDKLVENGEANIRSISLYSYYPKFTDSIFPVAGSYMREANDKELTDKVNGIIHKISSRGYDYYELKDEYVKNIIETIFEFNYEFFTKFMTEHHFAWQVKIVAESVISRANATYSLVDWLRYLFSKELVIDKHHYVLTIFLENL